MNDYFKEFLLNPAVHAIKSSLGEEPGTSNPTSYSNLILLLVVGVISWHVSKWRTSYQFMTDIKKTETC